jgi:hypothetical protein
VRRVALAVAAALALVPAGVGSASAASPGPARPPVAGGPVTQERAESAWRVARLEIKPKPDASGWIGDEPPHTTAGLRAFAASLGYPWQGIIICESLRDGSWRESSSSWARGIVQFLPSTWRSLGLRGDPAAASWAQQIAAARRLRARDGLGAWSCARILGYAR